MAQLQKRFPDLRVCNFDNGFHSPANQIPLKEKLELATLSKNGKLSRVVRTAEQVPSFVETKRAHSAVESAIIALEVHALDRSRSTASMDSSAMSRSLY